MNPWESAVWKVNILLTAAVLLNLWRIGLARKYKLLFLYLAADLVQSVSLMFLDYRSTAYADFYFPTQAAKITFAAFILVEIYSFVLQDRPALARFGRNAVGYVLLAAALIAASGLLWDQPAASAKQPILYRYLLVERTLTGTMAVFQILVVLFLAWFRTRLPRNQFLLIVGFLVSLLSRTTLVQLAKTFQGQRPLLVVLNTAYLVIASGCLLIWLFGLRPEGERRTAVVGQVWKAQEAGWFVRQLDNINLRIDRIGRR